MVVEPIDYSASTGRALLQGLTAGRAIQGMRQTSQEMDAAAQQRERQQAAYTALQNARPEDLPALRMQHPEFADLIQKEIGIQDAEHATFVNKALNKISIAAATGNPAMIQTAIEQNKPALMSFGVDPQEAIQMAHNDPQQFGSLLKASMYATMPIEKQVDAQQKQQQLDETARSNRAGESLQARGQNIAAANSAADRQIRLMQLKQEALTRQAASETNDLKRLELQQKVDANQRALQEKQQQVQKGKDMSYEAAKLARSIASNPQLDVVTGSIQSRLPKFEGASLDIINQAQQLQSMLTAGNLGLLKGAMSDKDIAFLQSMSSGLNVGDNGIKGSYDATKKKLNIIADKLERNLGGYVPEGESAPTGAQTPQAATTKSWSDLP